MEALNALLHVEFQHKTFGREGLGVIKDLLHFSWQIYETRFDKLNLQLCLIYLNMTASLYCKNIVTHLYIKTSDQS